MSPPIEKLPFPRIIVDHDPQWRFIYDGPHGKLSIVSSFGKQFPPQVVSRDEFLFSIRHINVSAVDRIMDVYDNTLFPAYGNEE